MTNLTRPPTTALAPDPVGSDANRSIRRASITAGVGLLLMSALAGFAKIGVLEGMVTDGNAAQTAADIVAAQGVFRLGIVSLFLVIVLDVAVAWGLYRVFSPVSRNMSMLAAAFRLVFAAVFLAAIGHLLEVLRLLDDDTYLSVFSAAQLHAQALLEIAAFTDLWTVALGLFALHLLVIGYLVHRSGYAPRWLGVLLAIAGLGYLIDAFGVVLSQSSWTEVGAFTFIGEFLLALWLVIRGSRLTVAS